MKKSLYPASIVLVLLLFAGLVSPAGAQRHGMGPGPERNKHTKNLENLRMLKLLELLELDDDQSAKFINMFVSFRKKIRQINMELQSEVEGLVELLKTDEPSDEEITAKLTEIDGLKMKREAEKKKFHDDVREILTAVQLGRMVVFEERFERELIESMRGFRERRRPQIGP